MVILQSFGVSTNATFQVSYATQLTAWSAGPEAGVAVAGLAQQASKLQLGKVHRFLKSSWQTFDFYVDHLP